MTRKKQKPIIIEGVTKSGKQFRPSDWAERMSGRLSTFRHHRIVYSPLLRPITKEGHKCVVLDPKLKESNPVLYNAVMEFADKNNLKIWQEDDNGGKKK